MPTDRSNPRLLIVGNDGGTNIGASLHRAAQAMGVVSELSDCRRAYEGPRVVGRFNWWLRDRRPTRLTAYSREVVEHCRRFQPAMMLATGLAPLTREALDEIRGMGIATANYLTDDPWNPAFRSRWFMAGLAAYDRIFSVRTRNLDDLARAGCRDVTYLPFAVDRDLFYPEDPAPSDRASFESDVCFVGGADRDRVPFIGALVDANLEVAVYGGYWGRYPETTDAWRGHAPPEVLRKATRAARISLCLVRRANRDGHTMRSFEVPAMGGCMLAEDTDEHRAFFGRDGDAVRYFDSAARMVDVARELLSDPAARMRLAAAGQQIIASGRHTYRDRLAAMLPAGAETVAYAQEAVGL